uniref:WD repeat domain-containing protein 83 n=1 Tax=Plectus sambesii TaxID=2011161 RepID=A0A914X4Z1_9BILA
MENVPTTLVKTIKCNQGAVRAVRFNVDGNYCLTCGSDKTVKLWNPYRGAPLKTYQGHGYEVLDACGSSDNSLIASGGLDKQLCVFDVETGKTYRKWRPHAARINAVAFNEESTVALSGSLDGTVRCYDMRTRGGEPIQTLDEARDSVTSLSVSDHEILAGSADCNVRRYDLRDGQMYMDFVGKSVTSVNFTKDGQCVLVSSMDGNVRLLDKSGGELLAEFTGHKNNDYKIDSCLLSTDAQVVSGSEDGSVYIWDLVESKLLVKLEHPGSQVVHSLSPHPTQQILMTASGSNVYAWQSADSELEFS